MTFDIGPNLTTLLSAALCGAVAYFVLDAIGGVAKAWIKGRGAVRVAEINAEADLKAAEAETGLHVLPGGRQ